MSIKIFNYSLFDKGAGKQNTPDLQTASVSVNQPYDSYDKKEDVQNTNKNSLYKWIGGLFATATGVFVAVKMICSGKGKKVVPPVVSGAQNACEKFIETMKPKNVEVAREFFNILEKHSKTFELTQKDYNTVLDAITPQNNDFIKQETFSLFEKYQAELKNIEANRFDLIKLLKTLNKDNTDLFGTFIQDSAKYSILEVSDIINYFLIQNQFLKKEGYR